jgi:hypothetical protein
MVRIFMPKHKMVALIPVLQSPVPVLHALVAVLRRSVPQPAANILLRKADFIKEKRQSRNNITG